MIFCRDGTVVDRTGVAAFPADLAVSDGRIAGVERGSTSITSADRLARSFVQ
jgi:N-acyl-D-aspartate/D-glutamate deacylase